MHCFDGEFVTEFRILKAAQNRFKMAKMQTKRMGNEIYFAAVWRMELFCRSNGTMNAITKEMDMNTRAKIKGFNLINYMHF